MLENNFTIETVTYQGDSGIPEISGYGKKINVSIRETPGSESMIKIGGFVFLRSQIESILKETCDFEKAVDAFRKSKENVIAE